jgi:hypothetical protein
VPSVDSVGDSYDVAPVARDALAETINELSKAEVFWRRGPHSDGTC